MCVSGGRDGNQSTAGGSPLLQQSTHRQGFHPSMPRTMAPTEYKLSLPPLRRDQKQTEKVTDTGAKGGKIPCDPLHWGC